PGSLRRIAIHPADGKEQTELTVLAPAGHAATFGSAKRAHVVLWCRFATVIAGRRGWTDIDRHDQHVHLVPLAEKSALTRVPRRPRDSKPFETQDARRRGRLPVAAARPDDSARNSWKRTEKSRP